MEAMDKNMSVTGTFVWTFDELKERQKALTAQPKNKPSVLMWISYFIIAILVIFFLFQLISDLTYLPVDTIQKNLPYVLPLPVLFAAFWVISTVSRNANLKQAFLESPDRDKTVLVTITPGEIVMKTAGIYEMKWAWASLLEVRRTPKGFCFFQAPRAGFWIPLHAFQSQNDIETVSEMAGRLASKYTLVTR